MKIFLDDERDPVENHDFDFIVRDYNEFITVCLFIDSMSYISFDHDLGIGKNGYDAAKILVETDMSCDGKYLSEDFDFYVHSQNPIGKKNIETFMNGYLNFKKSGEMK